MSCIRLINKDTDLINEEHTDYDYDIMIGNVLYNIARYPNYIHSYTENKINCYWVWPRTQERSYLNIIPYDGNFGANWGIDIKTINVRSGGMDKCVTQKIECCIIRNNMIFERLYYCNNMTYAIGNTLSRLERLKDLPCELNSKNWKANLLDRLISYKGYPARIEDYDADNLLKIKFDNSFTIPHNVAMSMNIEEEDSIYIDMLSEAIDWYYTIDIE